MGFAFTKATRTQAKARIALAGPSGSGKTYTALVLAKALGARIAVIDTEHGSSTKYAGEAEMPDFDVAALESFSPERYIEAIHAAEVAGYDVLIIDSLSHAWVGKDGVLEQVDLARARSKTGNAFTDGWRYASPLHNRLIETLLQSPLHLIVTMRSKTKYVLEEQHGRQVPKQVGMELVQRDGIEYEWDIVGELDKDNTLVITKSRCKALSSLSVAKPGEELGAAIKAWLSAGVPAPITLASAPATLPEPNGHQLLPKPPASGQEEARARVLAALQETLFRVDAHAKLHWLPGMKAAAERYLGSFTWATIKAMELEQLESRYAQLIVALAPARADEPEPEEDVPDFPPPKAEHPGSTAAAAEEVATHPPSPPSSSVPGAAGDEVKAALATEANLAELRLLAGRVDAKAAAEVENAISHAKGGLRLKDFTTMKQYLNKRLGSREPQPAMA